MFRSLLGTESLTPSVFDKVTLDLTSATVETYTFYKKTAIAGVLVLTYTDSGKGTLVSAIKTS